jgi:hypothetical protein
VKGGEIHGTGVLLQMPEKGGDEEPAERYLEKQETSNTWKLSILWNQGLPNWQRLIHLYALARA